MPEQVVPVGKGWRVGWGSAKEEPSGFYDNGHHGHGSAEPENRAQHDSLHSVKSRIDRICSFFPNLGPLLLKSQRPFNNFEVHFREA